MKNDEFEIAISKPLTSDEAKTILKSSFLTLRLVSEYDFFNQDRNYSIFKNYVDQSIGKNVNLYNAIEMARLINYYSPAINKCLAVIFTFSKNILLKLSCLDYLINLHVNFPKNRYLKLNELARIHTDSTLVKFQVCINLIYADIEIESNIDRVIKILTCQKDAAFYYRFISAINSISFRKALRKRLINIARSLLLANTVINSKQKNEILLTLLRKRIG